MKNNSPCKNICVVSDVVLNDRESAPSDINFILEDNGQVERDYLVNELAEKYEQVALCLFDDDDYDPANLICYQDFTDEEIDSVNL